MYTPRFRTRATDLAECHEVEIPRSGAFDDKRTAAAWNDSEGLTLSYDFSRHAWWITCNTCDASISAAHDEAYGFIVEHGDGHR